MESYDTVYHTTVYSGSKHMKAFHLAKPCWTTTRYHTPLIPCVFIEDKNGSSEITASRCSTFSLYMTILNLKMPKKWQHNMNCLLICFYLRIELGIQNPRSLTGPPKNALQWLLCHCLFNSLGLGKHFHVSAHSGAYGGKNQCTYLSTKS